MAIPNDYGPQIAGQERYQAQLEEMTKRVKTLEEKNAELFARNEAILASITKAYEDTVGATEKAPSRY